MSEPRKWPVLTLSDSPAQLLLGWKHNEGGIMTVDAQPVRLADGIGETLRQSCVEVLDRMVGMEECSSRGRPSLMPREYFSLSPNIGVDDKSDVGGAKPSKDDVEVTRLVDIVRTTYTRPDDFLTRAELKSHDHPAFQFYAIVAWLEDGRSIALIRRYAPQRGLASSRLYFISTDRDELTRFDDPLFILDLKNVDVVVTPDEVLVINIANSGAATVTAGILVTLFPDLITVPSETENADSVDLLGSNLKGAPLGEGSTKWIKAACKASDPLKFQLARISKLAHLAKIETPELRKALARHGQDVRLFGVGTTIDIGATRDVRILFNILEEVYYKTDFSKEQRVVRNYRGRTTADESLPDQQSKPELAVAAALR